MSLGDSLIAATALVNNDKLTNNVEDFIGISGLSVISLKSVF
jgi:predicted nucleic acid-binding protein